MLPYETASDPTVEAQYTGLSCASNASHKHGVGPVLLTDD
jgi:hypothetical protein